jgi:Recombination endonuclease VII
MLAEQAGVCAICSLDLPLSIDHDHVTGEVRGLLCSNCNLGIGNLRDDPEIIGSAIRYLTNAQARRMALKVV